MADTALALIEQTPAPVLFSPGFLDPIVQRVASEARAEAALLDISTDRGRKAIASLAFKVAKSKTFLDKQGKELVAEEKRRLALVDAERSRVWDALESIQREVRQPLTEWENAEKVRVGNHEAGLQRLSGFVQDAAGLPVNELDTLEMMADACFDRDWQEFSRRANDTRDEVQRAIAAQRVAAAEKAELQRLRFEQAEREQRERDLAIARAAEEKERARQQQEVHRAEQEAREAATRASQAIAQQQEAEQRHAVAMAEAAKQAEAGKTLAIEQERKRIEVEQARAQQEVAQRERDREHRASIHNAACSALVDAGLSSELARVAVIAIVSGRVPHVKVAY